MTSMSPVMQTIASAAAEFPKAPVSVFTLPCGHLDAAGVLHREVEVREISGNEEDMLNSRTVPGERKLGMLLERCVVRVGSIVEPQQVIQAVQTMRIGDRMFLAIAIRRATLGDDYPFETSCRQCRARGMYRINLDEFVVKPARDPLQSFFEVKLPRSGKVVQFRPLVGRDESAISKATSTEDAISLSILSRLVSVDGVPPTLEVAKSLGMQDRNALREEFDDVEGGVDTSTDVTCVKCGTEFAMEVDITQTGFFFPLRVLKAWKRRSST